MTSPPFLLLSPPHHRRSPSLPRPPALPVAAKVSHPPHRLPPRRLRSPSPPRSAALPVAAAPHSCQGPQPSPSQLLPITAKVHRPPHHGSSHSPSPPRSTARGTHCYPLALTNSELCFQQDQIIQPEPQCRQCPTRQRWRPPPRCPTAAALQSLWPRLRLLWRTSPVLHHRRRSRKYTLPFPWHIVRF